MANISVGRKSGFIVRGGQRKRETLWTNVTFGVDTLASGTPVNITTLSATGLALRPFTVIRARGLFSVATDQEAADEVQMAAYGACIVSDQAQAIGVTAIPTPVTDSGSDLWFAYQLGFAQFRFGDATGFGNISKEFEIDSRAMRKVEEGQTLVEVIENSAAGQGVNTLTGVRFLFKLH